MKPDLSLEVCGMFILTAGSMGLDAVDRLSDYAAELPVEALHASVRPLYAAIARNLELGRPPTAANLLDANPELSGQLLGKAKDAAGHEQGHNSLEAAIAALVTEHARTENHRLLSEAAEANKRGDHEMMSSIVSCLHVPDAEGPQSRSRFEDFDGAPALERPFQLTHSTLNHILRGGLGTGMLLGLSLWVAPTGMGKSTFWYAEIPHLCRQGHWVLYFAAESDDTNIYAEVIRLSARLTLDAVERMNKTPQFAEKFAKAREEMRQYMGKSFSVWSGPFDCNTVRREAERTLREMREAGATGKLLVIIDNYDALYEIAGESSKTAAMAINDEIHKLARHVGRHDYHIAMLAQSTAEDETRDGPGSGQVYGNRKIGQKFGTVVALYRPRAGEASTDKQPCIAVRKARQGRRANPVIPMQPDDAVGLWTQLHQLPF